MIAALKTLIIVLSMTISLSACNRTAGDTVYDAQHRGVSLAPDLEAARATYEPLALAYLEAALDTIQVFHAVGPDYDWEELRLAALEKTEGAQTPEATYEAIRFVLYDLPDTHDYFYPPGEVRLVDGLPWKPDADSMLIGLLRGVPPPSQRPELYSIDRIESTLLVDKYAYIFIPGFHATDSTAASEFASELQRQIRSLDIQDPCGWIVDLSRTGGGNMWPMLAGIGPILGNGIAGAFAYPDGRRISWLYEDGVARLDNSLAGENVLYMAKVKDASVPQIESNVPVAVLTSRNTGSSGEAITTAFRGRSNMRSFGGTTAGAVGTLTKFHQLSDGVTMGFAEVFFSDIAGTVYSGPIEPDVPVEPAYWNEPNEVFEAAIAWLQRHSSCR